MCLRFILSVFAGVLALSVFADGGFIPPPKWKGNITLREPLQKAVIVYDKGNEDMILQVKYASNIEQFAWIIPFPSKPKVDKVFYSPFFELEAASDEKLDHTPLDDVLENLEVQEIREMLIHLLRGGGHDGNDSEKETAVSVIERKRLDLYDVAVLQSTDSKALYKWLKVNGFGVPGNSVKIIDYYVQKKFFWVAVKIHLEAQNKKNEKLLKSGELPPLYFNFDVAEPFYPLYISSINDGGSELLIYLFAKELYAHKIFCSDSFPLPSLQDLLETLKIELVQIFYDDDLGDYSASSGKFPISSFKYNYKKKYFMYEPVIFFRQKNLIPSLLFTIPRLAQHAWYYTRFKKEITQKQMTDDLYFSSDHTLLKNIVNRIVDYELEKGYRFAKKQKPFVIPPLLNSNNRNFDSLETFLKEHTAGKLWKSDNRISEVLIKGLYTQKLSTSFLMYKCKTDNFRKEFIDLSLQAGQFPDMDLYPFLRPYITKLIGSPQSRVLEYILVHYGVKYSFGKFSGLQHGPKFSQILKSFKSLAERRQFYALSMLYFYRDPISFDLLKTWLLSPDLNTRMVALDLIACSLQNTTDYCGFRNSVKVRPYLHMTADDNYKELKNILRLLLKSYPETSHKCIYILTYLNNTEIKDDMIKILKRCSRIHYPEIAKLSFGRQLEYHEKLTSLSTVSLNAIRLFPDKEYIQILKELLTSCKDEIGFGIDYRELLNTASSKPYVNDPAIRELLFTTKNLRVFHSAWLDSRINYYGPKKGELSPETQKWIWNKIHNMKDKDERKIWWNQFSEEFED